MTRERLSALIVDDERLARQELRTLLALHPEVEVRGEAASVDEAARQLAREQPDVIFLDIQIPGITGIDFLKILKNPPQVIITTAYSDYAIEAFELDVRDYLMKPFSFDRFLKAVNRISPKPDVQQIHQLQPATNEKSFAFFNVNKMMVKVMFDDIRYIESMREYVYIYTDENKIITKIGLGEIEKMLGPNFLRIHRSYVINRDKISAFNAEEIFIGKVTLPIGTNFKKMIESSLRSYIKN